MSTPISVCLFAVGTLLWVYSMLMMSRANRGARIPLWKSPPHTPVAARLTRALAAALIIFGTVNSGSYLGPGGLVTLILLVMVLPWIVLISLHNRGAPPKNAMENGATPAPLRAPRR